jgi:hypothetical protein
MKGMIESSDDLHVSHTMDGSTEVDREVEQEEGEGDQVQYA